MFVVGLTEVLGGLTRGLRRLCFIRKAPWKFVKATNPLLSTGLLFWQIFMGLFVWNRAGTSLSESPNTSVRPTMNVRFKGRLLTHIVMANAKESHHSSASSLSSFYWIYLQGTINIIQTQIQNANYITTSLNKVRHPRPTQPSTPPGSVNEYQLRLGRQMQV